MKIYINATASVIPGVDGVPGRLVDTRETMAALGPLWNPLRNEKVPLDWAVQKLGFDTQALSVDPGTWKLLPNDHGGIGDSHLAYAVGKAVMNKAGVQPNEVDVLIHVTCTPATVFCGTHFRDLTAKLELRKDIIPMLQNWGCAGLLPALETAASYLNGSPFRRVRKVLVVATNFPSGFMANKSMLARYSNSATNVDDWLAPIMFGDGAFGALLSCEPAESSFELVDLAWRRNGVAMVDYPAGGSDMPTTPETLDWHRFIVYAKAVKSEFMSGISDSITWMLSDWNKRIVPRLGGSSVDPTNSVNWHEAFAFVVAHQANAMLLRQVVEQVGVPLEKVPIVSSHYGNQSSAAIGVALDSLVQAGRIKSGDLIPCLAVGEGGGKMFGYFLLRAV